MGAGRRLRNLVAACCPPYTAKREQHLVHPAFRRPCEPSGGRLAWLALLPSAIWHRLRGTGRGGRVPGGSEDAPQVPAQVRRLVPSEPREREDSYV